MCIILVRFLISDYLRKEKKKTRLCRKNWFGFYCGTFIYASITTAATAIIIAVTTTTIIMVK